MRKYVASNGSIELQSFQRYICSEEISKLATPTSTIVKNYISSIFHSIDSILEVIPVPGANVRQNDEAEQAMYFLINK